MYVFLNVIRSNTALASKHAYRKLEDSLPSAHTYITDTTDCHM